MSKNPEIKYLVVCLLAYSLGGIFIWQHIIGDRFYVYEDLRHAIGLFIVSFWLTLAYERGIKEIGYTIALHLWNWFVFCAVIDGINVAIVYNQTFPSQVEGNKILNQNLVYFDLMICGGIWAVINLIFFCILLPKIPEWLHK